MKIRKLQATFGKLQGETLPLHSGLNVIYAPNESGKSTWCAFIRTMLYGMDQSGAIPDRLRYAPWSGAPMEGTMDLTADRCDMTLTRRTMTRSAPMQEFSAVYSGTETPVEGMTGQNCGELLTGVSREVFLRSAFIGQGAVSLRGGPELERRIQSIVSSGEEQVSFPDAEARLESWQRRRRSERGGLLPSLENEIRGAENLLREMETSGQSVKELQAELEETHRACEQLETQVTEARRKQRADALTRLREGRELVQDRSDRHDEALAEVARTRDALRRSEFGNLSSEELRAQVEEDKEKLREAGAGPDRRSGILPAILFSVLAILGAAFYGVTSELWLILLAALCCAGSVFFFMRYSKQRLAAQSSEARRDEIMRRYKISLPDDLDEVVRKREELEEDILRAEEEERRSRERLEKAGRSLRELEENAVNELDFTSGDSEAARLSRELQKKRNEASALAAKISGLNGRLSIMGDPPVLRSSILSMEERRDTLQAEYEAITLALEMLRTADGEIRSRFSPELSKLAAEYMSEMTGGRYEEVRIGSDFSARARSGDDDVAHEADYLSAGTTDLLYLAVRLAVCELALPAGEPCPLVIDDALVNLDNTRYEQAMELLKKIALNRQIILFTCRRE